MKTIDWTKLFQEYKGQWVALMDDQTTVIAAGLDLKHVRAEAAIKGHPDPIFTRVPTEITYLVGSVT